ncbi:long-chain-fatty-acid--CoA ligase [bacterium BMS3Bbin05]|nr:long-chain-fatty-acid--CoA ligase [bacterium BMS3Bbin05]
MNIPEFFFRKSRGHLGKTAFISFSEEGRIDLSYMETVSSVMDLAAFLSGKIKKGKKIAICAENRPEWCIAYMAILTIGCIAVPADTELGEKEIKNIIEASGCIFSFCSDKTVDKIRASGIPDSDIFNIDKHFNEIAEGSDIDLNAFLSNISPDDIASIIFTSGTTGAPKGVMLTHKNFYSDAIAVMDTGIILEKDNVLSVLPLYHTYAFMCTFLVPLLVGATVTYSPSLKGPDIARAVREGGVTILVGVPQLLDLFHSAIVRNIDSMTFMKRSVARALINVSRFVRENTGLNIGRKLFRQVHERFGKQFRLMASGGASLNVLTIGGLESFGFTVLEGYGLTETSPVVTFNPLNRARPGSAGIPLSNVEIRIAGDRKDAQNPEGEVLIKGDMVMKGYYNMPEETAKVLKDGWFYSGDLGYFDEDGYLFLTGRKKDVIVLSSGKNIYPEEIEEEYRTLPLINEICVLEMRQGDTVTLHAVVVPDFEYARAAGIANLYDALKWDIQGVSLKLPSYMRINGFTLHTEPFPRTRLGKLKRFMVREILEKIELNEKAKEVIKPEELDGIEKEVVSAVALFAHEGMRVKLRDNLELDIGIDSLKRIALSAELERVFSVRLPETFMTDIQTVSEICDKLKQSELESVEDSENGGRSFRDLLLRRPGDDQIRSIGLVQGLISKAVIWSVLRVLKLFFKIYFRSTVKGVENIPESPFILVSNHSSYLDSFMIGSHVPFKVFMNLFFQGARKYFRTGQMKCFAKLAHVIPIDPDAYLVSAFSLSAHVLNEKKSLCIFPEGGRSFDGNIMPFRKGIGILAAELGVPVVPARIHGTYESMSRGKAFPKKTKLTLSIGEPITADVIDKIREKGGDVYQEIADFVKVRVNSL